VVDTDMLYFVSYTGNGSLLLVNGLTTPVWIEWCVTVLAQHICMLID